MTQEKALQRLIWGANCLLTGKAGTGKTYLVQEFIKQMRSKGEIVIIVAPTGIAAINIGGATIHSTFKMYGNYFRPRLPKKQSVDWKAVDVLVIDEISMVGPDYLDYIDYTLKKSRKNDEPFGGIQVVLVGDSKQLPPIYSNHTEQDKLDMEGLIDKYGSLTFDKALSFKDFEVLDLVKVYRQTNETMIGYLNDIRDGDLTVISKFNKGYGDEKSIHLKPYNSMVDSHNQKEFDKLIGPIHEYKGIVTGNFNSKNCITPELLQLKVGTKIMVTKNLKCGLVNGDMGIVRECYSGGVQIYSYRFDTEFTIGFEEWKEITYDGISEVVIGSYKQVPLKMAWAITIHKSQGLSLDNVCLSCVKGMSTELVYVGLSRCTNFENLYINQI